MRIPLSRPDISESDISAVTAVLRSNQLSLGPAVPAFEEAIAAFVGAKHAVAVSSGTAALHLGVRGLGIGNGDEVITTPFSFVASTNCLLYEGATPRFVDIEPRTFGIDPAAVERAITKKTKAILAVDVFGYLADWDALRAIAEKHHLLLIEDSCEALGTKKGGKAAGTFGDVGTFAFYPNKQMTTGEGGMLVTNDDDLARAARMMRNQGRDPQSGWLAHEVLGYNYRLSDIQSALGTSQMQRLPELVAKRSHVATWYGEALAALANDVIVPVEQEGVDVSWFVYVVRLADRYSAAERDALIQFLRAEGIGCSNYFPPLHLQPALGGLGYKKGDFPVTEGIADRTLALPFFPNLSQEEIRTVAETLQEGLRRLRPSDSPSA